MNTQQIILHGQIQADGTLQIEEKVNLPPGPVSITIQTVRAKEGKGTLQVLKEIWAERESLGIAGRSKEEIDAEINAMRDEDEKRMREIEAIAQQASEKKE